ncbi:MAG: rRNA maturation RNase YbeY [Emergencia timonensis]|uniref:rRNA maturation RNase YbeY n=1 Tax=Emergencia timonensis TaxID=1776384 RepID=UPI000831550B|nr:rRNA maturation RNase YbeY [Emergencia timonensis]WNX87635.1 rRNA maturation RNase YbeY [Emergencia timonensis]
MNIYFEDGQVVDETILATMKKAAEYCLDLEQVDQERTEISVTFVEGEEIRNLNREYRDTDKVTDVLSFPQFDDLDEIPEFGEICLGDVVICKDRALEQAEEFGHSFEREIIYLFTHSILHLLGYDHMEEDEKKEMRQREEEVMAHLGILRDSRGE